MQTDAGPDGRRNALIAGASAYLIWGLLPIYLKALAHVPAADVLAYRVLWSLALCVALALISGAMGATLAVLRDPRRLGLLTVSALVIGGNWLLYIWAIANNHVVDASLGYFINPLLNVLLGVVLLREKLDRAAQLAVALAVAGVVIMTVERGGLPWVSLTLAMSFAFYGLVRKYVPVAPVPGLLVETLVLAPAALLWMATGQRTALGGDMATALLLIGAGPITAVPLMMFAYAARRLELTTIGLMQYVAPTMIFLLGVFAYHEPLSMPQLIAFALIWAGVAVYAADGIRQARRRALAQADPVR